MMVQFAANHDQWYLTMTYAEASHTATWNIFNNTFSVLSKSQQSNIQDNHFKEAYHD